MMIAAGLHVGLDQFRTRRSGRAGCWRRSRRWTLGGLGSLWGTLVGGIVLGLAQNAGAHFDAAWQTLAQHLVFLVILVLRPQGLFAKG